MLIIGHRGSAGYEPENTLRSFKKALTLGVDAIELDVHLSLDKNLIVIHDETVDRTTSGKGYVAKKSLQELKQLDAGKGESIPTLQEALNLINKRALVNIELKGVGTGKSVARVIEAYVRQHNWTYNDFLISSFNTKELQECNQINPQIKIGLLLENIPIMDIKSFAKLRIKALIIDYKVINQIAVKKCRDQNLQICVYTVNNLGDIARMKGLDVDGIISDYPDRI